MRLRGRNFAIALAAPAAVVLLALSLGGAGGDGDGGNDASPPDRAEPAPVAAPASPGGAGGDGGNDGSPPDRAEPAPIAATASPAPADRARRDRHRLRLAAPKRAHPIVWVRRRERIAVRTEPGSGKLAEVLERKTDFGSPTVLGVVRRFKRWVGVSVPSLPNDELGWIRLDSRRLRSGWVRESIVVDRSERRAVLRRGGRPVRSFKVSVGAPGSETPPGRFAVTDTFRGGLNPAYGCCALALSAIQPNLPSGWLGGNRIAIHGNGVGGPLGAEVSSGCVRAADEDVDALVDAVPLGTPVFIR
ncbi:MAG TPA: L,D-transpeptidase [Solirubrobacterales bacterium]|nr:L,D-transpeptidase [Solirubrobacterales bacterium]